MNQPVVSASDFEGMLSPPVLSAEWNAFAMQIGNGPLEMNAVFQDHVVGLNMSGTHRVRQQVAGRATDRTIHNGFISVIPAQVDFKVDASISARFGVFFVPHAFLSRVITEHWEEDPKKIGVVWQYPTEDRVVESVMKRLIFEAENNSPSGRLYAESACEFLAHHLVRFYSSIAAPPVRTSGGLPGGRLKMVLDYIDDNIAKPIALRGLAEIAGVSARHFERAFREAMGTPPFAYVLTRRIAVARGLLLARPELSVEEIAMKTGFSSSSHLSAAFRRQTGYSPMQFRRAYSR